MKHVRSDDEDGLDSKSGAESKDFDDTEDEFSIDPHRHGSGVYSDPGTVREKTLSPRKNTSDAKIKYREWTQGEVLSYKDSDLTVKMIGINRVHVVDAAKCRFQTSLSSVDVSKSELMLVRSGASRKVPSIESISFVNRENTYFDIIHCRVNGVEFGTFQQDLDSPIIDDNIKRRICNLLYIQWTALHERVDRSCRNEYEFQMGDF